MTTDTIATKIKALLAKADSSTHEAEAETFMRKAHELLEKHGLSLLDVGRLGDDAVGHDKNVARSSDAWKDKIAFQLARYYGCRMVREPSGRTTRDYTIFGRESARITFQLMLPYVWRQVAKLANEGYKRGEFKSASRGKNLIGNALAVRIYHLTQDREEKETRPTTGTNALVPVDMIEAEISDVYPELTTAKFRYGSTNAARKAADRVSLNQQTPAAAGTLRIQ